MALPPDILTRRLRLTPFSERHLTKRYVGWLNDKDLMKYSEQRHKHHTLETCRLYWESFRSSPHYFWAIEESTYGHIGNIQAYVDLNNRLADVGLLIGERAAAHQHFGFEAWVGVCHFLFTTAGMRKVTGGTMAENLPMCRIMKRAGMIPDGRRHRHFLLNEREVDVVHYALFRDQWAQLLATKDGGYIASCLRRPPETDAVATRREARED